MYLFGISKCYCLVGLSQWEFEVIAMMSLLCAAVCVHVWLDLVGSTELCCHTSLNLGENILQFVPFVANNAVVYAICMHVMYV